MMKVAVLSDTHLREGQRLPGPVQHIVDHVDLVVHAGDLISEYPFAELREQGRFVAVRGNCDWDLTLPEKMMVQCQELKIGLVHGYQFRSAQQMCAAFDEDVRLIVFGHSHIPRVQRVHLEEEAQECVLFNPGSPTQRRRQPHASMGLLKVDGSEFEVEHIYFED